MSGLLEGSTLRKLKTLATINSWRWCLHARLIKSLLNFCSRKTQAPALQPARSCVASPVQLGICRHLRASWCLLPTLTLVAYQLPLLMLMLAASCQPYASSEQYLERKTPGFPSQLILLHGLHFNMGDNMGSKYNKELLRITISLSTANAFRLCRPLCNVWTSCCKRIAKQNCGISYIVQYMVPY